MSSPDFTDEIREGDDSTCVALHPTTGERCIRLAGHVDYAPLHWPSTEGREWCDAGDMQHMNGGVQ